MRKESIRDKREQYLYSRTDKESADYLISLWNEEGLEVSEESLSAESFSEEKIFANDSKNKFTEYGNSVALKYLLSIPEVERAIKFASFDFEDLKSSLDKGFATEEQKQNFLIRRSCWFSHLKDRMRELKISKETLQSFGFDWKAAKSFAYRTI